MFKIGEFSTISRVPVKTLRYYDEIGLLAPDHVDKFTSYRYYSLEQLPRLNRILALKDLRLSLAQIGKLLDDDVSPEEIRGMLRLKQAEIQQHVEEEQARLRRVEARLRQIEQEGKMPEIDVVIKKLETQNVIALRETVTAPEEVGRMFGECFTVLGQNGIQPCGPPLTIYHNPEFNPASIDLEVVFPLNQPISDNIALSGGRELVVKQLPAVDSAACTIHKGEWEHEGFAATYAAIGQWIEASNYHIVGPVREIYLTHESSPDAMTEIQFPVQKA